ncbi:hypothetical protein ALT717_10226 [Alteromonas macleodii]
MDLTMASARDIRSLEQILGWPEKNVYNLTKKKHKMLFKTISCLG